MISGWSHTEIDRTAARRRTTGRGSWWAIRSGPGGRRGTRAVGSQGPFTAAAGGYRVDPSPYFRFLTQTESHSFLIPLVIGDGLKLGCETDHFLQHLSSAIHVPTGPE